MQRIDLTCAVSIATLLLSGCLSGGGGSSSDTSGGNAAASTTGAAATPAVASTGNETAASTGTASASGGTSSSGSGSAGSGSASAGTAGTGATAPGTSETPTPAPLPVALPLPPQGVITPIRRPLDTTTGVPASLATYLTHRVVDVVAYGTHNRDGWYIGTDGQKYPIPPNADPLDPTLASQFYAVRLHAQPGFFARVRVEVAGLPSIAGASGIMSVGCGIYVDGVRQAVSASLPIRLFAPGRPDATGAAECSFLVPAVP